MGEIGAVKANSIKQIFETMEYGNGTENIAKAIEWLKTKESSIFAYIDKKDESPNGTALPLINASNEEDLCKIYVPEETTVETILTKVGGAKNVWLELPPVKRAQILHKFGTEIQKKQDLFVQLEIASRGILTKDTKTKALPALTDCLQYYSSFSVKGNCENPTWKPEGVAVAILSDENCLSSLGYVLGPCLASGHTVVLQTGPQLSIISTLLIEIATQVGVPEGTIRLIPGDVNPNVFFTHPKVSVVTVFDDLYKEKYQIANHFNKKLLHFYSSGSPMLVFDNCDLDSACHSVVDAVWGYNGMLPWSVRNIYVQETIFEGFTQKLRHKISQLKVGTSAEKNLDISYPHGKILDNLAELIEKGKNEGAEVYQPSEHNIPTLLIGGNVFNNNVIKEDSVNAPIVSLAAFRTINEAVALANNTRQGLAVSVWSESTSLVHEIMGKLNFGNIWINSHGLSSVNVATSPHKTSGNAFIGGSAGFSEYTQTKALKSENISQAHTAEAMEKTITEAKKAQSGWAKQSRLDRTKAMQVLAQTIITSKNWSLPDKWLEDWNTAIHSYILSPSDESFTKTGSFNVVSTREPCGVLAIETLEDKDTHNKKVIIAGLAEGNSVIILNDSKETAQFYSELSKVLPKGVLAVIAHSQDATKVAALHKELNVYVGEKTNKVFASLPLKTSSKFKQVSQHSWSEVRNTVTLVKNVWFNKGQSFI